MQKLTRTRKAVVASALIGLGCTNLVVVNAALASDVPGMSMSPSIEQIEALSFFDRTSEITATVDLSHPSAGPTLQSSSAVLDGVAIQATGIEVASSEQRRQQDALLSMSDVVTPPVGLNRCDELPIGDLCVPLEGPPLSDVIDAMVQELVTADQRAVVIEYDGAHVSVDLPSFEPLAKHDGFIFNHRLTAALLANEEVRTAAISAEGDCRLYAHLVGMDQCIQIKRADLEALLEDVK